MGGFAKRLLARLGIWRGDELSTVPPELAACEYDCVKNDCDEEHFETCERRLHTADVLRAEAAAQGPGTGEETPEACVVPPLAAGSGVPASASAAGVPAAR